MRPGIASSLRRTIDVNLDVGGLPEVREILEKSQAISGYGHAREEESLGASWKLCASSSRASPAALLAPRSFLRTRPPPCRRPEHPRAEPLQRRFFQSAR